MAGHEWGGVVVVGVWVCVCVCVWGGGGWREANSHPQHLGFFTGKTGQTSWLHLG